MPRKAHKFHYIYKTTCNVTRKYYIGMHSTSNLEDGYMGSGKRLRRSLIKHGRDNHTVEILEWFPDRNSLSIRESEIVNEQLLQDPLNINLQIGGGTSGKNYSREHSIETRKLISEKLKDKSYEEIHGIESANIEKSKRRQGVQKYWDSISKEQKAERISKQIGIKKPRVNPEKLKTCPHCNISARPSNIKRWHLDNCKNKILKKLKLSKISDI